MIIGACAVLVVLAAACTPTIGDANRRATSQPRRAADSSIRGCSGNASVVPYRAVNFDLFIATTDDLRQVFPGSLPPRSVPLAKTFSEVRNPFTGRLIAGPFDPPLTVLSFEPDGPWANTATTLDLKAVAARRLPWVECAGLFYDGFEVLGDVLGVPRPSLDEWHRALSLTPERLVTVLYPPPNTAHSVQMFPADFQDAIAGVHDSAALGMQWSKAYRASQIAAGESAKAKGFEGREEPPPDAEQLRPFFTGLAADIVTLARVGMSTRRNLYLHTWPD